jgi:hypothetical protein
MVDSIIANVKDKIKIAVKVRSKESSSNFESSFNVNKNINLDILNKNIHVFNTRIKNASIVLQNFIKNAFIILDHKYGNSDNMWGVKNIKKYMEDIRNKIASNNVEINKLDFYKEMLERNADKLYIKLASVSVMNNPEEKKIVSQVLIPDTVSNYEKFKDLATKTIVILSPLIYVEDLFKKNTNYPANWFVSDDILMNIGEDYNFLINFMQDIPKIENNVIVPLELLGQKF